LRFWRKLGLTTARGQSLEEEEPLIQPTLTSTRLPSVPKDDTALDRRDIRSWKDLRREPKHGLYLQLIKLIRMIARDDSMCLFLHRAGVDHL
jgi:hypothetical protein